jgi:hypothetical protein
MPDIRGDSIMSKAISSEQAMKVDWGAVGTRRRTPIEATGARVWQKLTLAGRSMAGWPIARLIMVSPEDNRASIKSRPEYTAADEFKETIDPKKGAKYEWVWTYAGKKFERVEGIFRALDEKANDIIKYMGGGTGLFALGALAKVTHETRWVIIWALPSFVLAIIAIAHAARARQPAAVCEPPSVESAFKYASHYGDESETYFIGQWHLACKALQMAIEDKAHRIDVATRCYVWALALLVLPIIAAIASL